MNPFAAAAGSLTPRIGDHAAAASAEPFPTESTSLNGGPEVTGTQKNNVAGSDGVGAAMQPAVADPFGHETIGLLSRASQSLGLAPISVAPADKGLQAGCRRERARPVHGQVTSAWPFREYLLGGREP